MVPANLRTRCLHARANGGRVFGVALIGQLLVIDAGHFDVDVDAVQQGPLMRFW